MTDFQLPDWSAPLDTPARLAGLPSGRTVKGLILRGVAEQCRLAGQSDAAPERYIPFKDYPLKDLIELLPQAARAVHGDVPPREGVRRLGRTAYRSFRDSMVGRVTFSLKGRTFEDALKTVSQIYTTVSGTPIHLAEAGAGRAVLNLRGVWTFPDCYHVGVFEQAMLDYGKAGQVHVRTLSLCDLDFRLEWV